MDRNFDNQIIDLKKIMLEMGSYVEQALDLAVKGLSQKDITILASIHKIEDHINDLQKKIDSDCLTVLAKQGPVAKDLRLILSIIKINTDLERMGDQCVNIAYLGKDIINRKDQISLVDIEKMFTSVKKMVSASLECFIKLDSEAAEKVLKMDDEVDALKDLVVAKSIVQMKQQPEFVESLLEVILIARNLERLGDHSTNVAEDVIFAFTGKDIRHGMNV